MTLNDNLVILHLYDFEQDPEVITQTVGLSPSRSGLRGHSYIDAKGKAIGKRTNKTNFWQYEWRRQTNSYIGDMVDAFIDEIIGNNIAALMSIPQPVNVELKIIQYYYDGCNPGCHMSATSIDYLHKIGAEVDFDIYALGGE